MAANRWPDAGWFGCACEFHRAEDFGPTEAVEWCGFHATMRDKVRALLAAVEPQEPLFGAYGMKAVDAYNELRAFMDEHAKPEPPAEDTGSQK